MRRYFSLSNVAVLFKSVNKYSIDIGLNTHNYCSVFPRLVENLTLLVVTF